MESQRVVSEDTMEGPHLFAWSVVAYSAFPLLFAVRRSRVQFLLLYSHMAGVFLFGSAVAKLYRVSLSDSVAIDAGQISYAGFIFAAIITVVLGRDLQVVRNLIVLTASIVLVGFCLLRLTHLALVTDTTRMVFAVDESIFAVSPLGAVLLAVAVTGELLLLMLMLESAKRYLPTTVMPAVYPLAFVVVLMLHGLLRTPWADRSGTGSGSNMGEILTQSMLSQLAVTLAFLVPLLLFVGLYRQSVSAFEARPINLRHLISLSRDDLLEELETQSHELAEQRSRALATTASMGRASATVDRILESATTTVLIALDTQLQITHFNTGAQELLGWSPDEVNGQSLEILLPSDELRRHAQALGANPDLHQVISAQMRVGDRRDWSLVAKDSTRPTISLGVSEVVVDGQVVGHVAAGEDVSSRLRVETAMMTAMCREHDALVRLQEADRMKNELVSTVSHELRTPIASITGYTEMLHDGAYGELSSQQMGALDRVLRNTTRLELLVDDLLVLERVETAPLLLESEPLDLSDVIRGTQLIVAEMVRGRDLKFTVSLPALPVIVNGDRAALERLVLNLLSNAVKFTPGSGTISLRVAQDSTNAWLSVTDTGLGVSEEDQAQLFARFFRSSRANELAIPGSGLGLSIVHAVVTSHGGEVSVASRPGAGSTFTVSLPLDPSLDLPAQISQAG